MSSVDDFPGSSGVSAPSLVFLHLSDLHFRAPGTALADRERSLRNRLLEDIPAAVAATDSGHVEAVLLSGDIAQSGQRAEYVAAREWLDELCAGLEISPTRTLSCPGNHDIDWNRVGAKRRETNAQLRTCATHLLDAEIDKLLEDLASDILGPLENYNEFAAGIACSLEKYLAWDLPTIGFGAGYSVAIRGATSVINSDADDGAGTMAVQSNQLLVEQRPGQLNVLLIHHGTHFWRRPQPGPAQSGHHLALYGHTHEPHHQVINGSCLELTAGAVHPEEHEAFAVPSYNVIEVSPDDGVPVAVGQDCIRIRVIRRSYSSARGKFLGTVGPEVDETLLVMAPREGPSSERTAPSPAARPAEGSSALTGAILEAPLEDSMGAPDLSRLIRLEFERLGAGNRFRVLDAVGLMTDELVRLAPHILIRRVADVVIEAGLVDEFRAAVRSAQY